jgi:hypothetical protein
LAFAFAFYSIANRILDRQCSNVWRALFFGCTMVVLGIQTTWREVICVGIQYMCRSFHWYRVNRKPDILDNVEQLDAPPELWIDIQITSKTAFRQMYIKLQNGISLRKPF